MTMAEYRKKPDTRIFEPEQYTEFSSLNPRGVCLGYPEQCNYVAQPPGGNNAHVHTIHKDQVCILEFGDWVMSEPDGIHYYSIKSDIFDATYELADTPLSPGVQGRAAEIVDGFWDELPLDYIGTGTSKGTAAQERRDKASIVSTIAAALATRGAGTADHVSSEQIVYNVAQRDPGFRKHLIEQLTAMGDEVDRGPLRQMSAAPVPVGSDAAEICAEIAREMSTKKLQWIGKGEPDAARVCAGAAKMLREAERRIRAAAPPATTAQDAPFAGRYDEKAIFEAIWTATEGFKGVLNELQRDQISVDTIVKLRAASGGKADEGES